MIGLDVGEHLGDVQLHDLIVVLHEVHNIPYHTTRAVNYILKLVTCVTYIILEKYSERYKEKLPQSGPGLVPLTLEHISVVVDHLQQCRSFVGTIITNANTVDTSLMYTIEDKRSEVI